MSGQPAGDFGKIAVGGQGIAGRGEELQKADCRMGI